MRFRLPRRDGWPICAWLRVADARQQPAVRLAVEWQAEGRQQYRYAAVGQSQFGEKEESVPESWKLYYFLVSDLPPESVSQLRVRIDLMSPGEVWVDDVQLFDLIFDEDQKKERTELVKMIWHYTGLLQKGQVGDCLRFLESYWPRYLTTHVPLVNNPEVAMSPRTAAQQKRPPAAPPEEPKKPGILERLKQYVPGRSWF